mgnify:CR=1 FL=1
MAREPFRGLLEEYVWPSKPKDVDIGFIFLGAAAFIIGTGISARSTKIEGGRGIVPRPVEGTVIREG